MDIKALIDKAVAIATARRQAASPAPGQDTAQSNQEQDETTTLPPHMLTGFVPRPTTRGFYPVEATDPDKTQPSSEDQPDDQTT